MPGVDPYEYFRDLMRLYSPQFRLEEDLAEVKETSEAIREALLGEGGVAQSATFQSRVLEQLSAIREAQKGREPPGDPLHSFDTHAQEQLALLAAFKGEVIGEIKGALEGLNGVLRGGDGPPRAAASDGCAKIIDELYHQRADLAGQLTKLVTVVANCLRDMETFIEHHYYDDDARELPRQLYEGIVGQFANVGIVRFEPSPNEPFRPHEHDGDGARVTKVRGTSLGGYKWRDGAREQVLVKAKVY